MTEPAHQFVAFVSYSHKDAAWAKWVQREIERYRLPAAFAKEKGLPKRLGKVFRDREELSTGQNLGDHLTAALDHSQNLIVICSPNAVQSKWVSQEIEYFKNLGRGDRIFALLVEGGAESLPEPLLTDVHGNALEPLASDPRKDADGKRLAKLKLIAGMLGTNLDQPARRERARRQQQLFTYVGVANVFLIAVGAALFQAEQKARERELGIENVMSMTDFVKRTRQYYDVGALKYVSDEFSEYLERFDDQELTTDQKAAKADALRVVGEASYDLGDVEKSLQAYQDSRELYYQASSETPADVDIAIEAAFANFYVGVTHFYEGNLTAAKQPLENYAEQISALFEENPDHAVLLSESIAAPTALLTLEVDSSSAMTAELAFYIEKASAAVDAALSIAPDSTDILYLAQGPMDFAADAHMKSCEVFNALPYQKRAVEYARRAVDLDPRNRQYKTDLANALFAYAGITRLSGNAADAFEHYLDAHKIQTHLLADDPENEYLKERLQNTEIELFSTTVFYPEYEQRLVNAGLGEVLNLRDAVGLSPTLDLYVLAFSTYKNHPDMAQRALDSFFDLTVDRDESAIRGQLAVTMHRLAQYVMNTTLDFPLAPTNQDSLSDCNSRFITWANTEMTGDHMAADEIRAEAEELGLLGTLLHFYSKQTSASAHINSRFHYSPSPDAE